MRARLGVATAVAGVTVLVAACGSSGATAGGATAAGPSAGSTASLTPTADKLATISIASTPDGSHLVAGGRAIYLWTGDRGSTSSCTGACAKAWPPVLTSGGTPRVSAGITSAALATTRRGHGEEQVTYHGHPLYSFAADSGRGTAGGQGSDAFGARWYLITPAGTADTTTSTSATSTPGGPGGSGGSGGGW